jgi:fructose-1,6-bisphosphatase/inositol monophosphatase family enzyme
VIYPNIDIWDSAAGVLVCQESGLLLSNINGGQDIYNEKSLIGAPTWLHKKILKKINQS